MALVDFFCASVMWFGESETPGLGRSRGTVVIVDVIHVDIWVTFDHRDNSWIPNRVEDGQGKSSTRAGYGSDLV